MSYRPGIPGTGVARLPPAHPAGHDAAQERPFLHRRSRRHRRRVDRQVGGRLQRAGRDPERGRGLRAVRPGGHWQDVPRV